MMYTKQQCLTSFLRSGSLEAESEVGIFVQVISSSVFQRRVCKRRVQGEELSKDMVVSAGLQSDPMGINGITWLIPLLRPGSGLLCSYVVQS